MKLLIAAALFFVLSPGVLVTLPGARFSPLVVALVHGVIFAVVFKLVASSPMAEGFQNPNDDGFVAETDRMTMCKGKKAGDSCTGRPCKGEKKGKRVTAGTCQLFGKGTNLRCTNMTCA